MLPTSHQGRQDRITLLVPDACIGSRRSYQTATFQACNQLTSSASPLATLKRCCRSKLLAPPAPATYTADASPRELHSVEGRISRGQKARHKMRSQAGIWGSTGS